MSKLLNFSAERGAVMAERAGRPSRTPAEEKVDLHLHSTFSDGVRTPDELCAMAHRAGVAFLALCDHDTTAGQAAMRSACTRFPSLTLIPGVEVSTGENGRLHILGYGERVCCDEVTAFLHGVASDRVQRAQKTLDLLAAQGIHVPQEQREQLLQNTQVGRPHIARALVEMGVVSTVRQAFDRYLNQGRCAYVPRSLPSALDTIALLRRVGAVPVWAHPLQAELDFAATAALAEEMKRHGLMGMEAYHSSVTPRQARQLEALARRMNLLVTGGSDYHGDPASTVRIGKLPAGWHSRLQDVQELLEATHE